MARKETINASPTKAFFIEMLTRDIELIPAIVDLVDNCVDGARRAKGDGPYTGLFVRITVDPDKFLIVDNCGGIELETALKYAFRFGRPRKMGRTSGSIGQFGVGMKRALFKLGTHFTVRSTAAQSTFLLEVNVPDWRETPEWEFPVEVREHKKAVPLAKRGTAITVDQLHDSVAEDFSLPTFVARLREELARAHQYHVGKGLAITLNGTPIEVDVGTLLQSDEIGPAINELSINGAEDPVDVKLFCGIAKSSPREAGWYVYCNGRLVLEADQSAVTGWGARGGQAVPSYHNQFAAFRGYAFLESDDAGRLPWNTTKTGLDGDSDVYRRVRSEMLQMMRPVITFLNRLDAEKAMEDEAGTGRLALAVKGAKSVTLDKAKGASTFVWPEEAPRPKKPKTTGRIQYDRPVSRIKAVQEALGVTTYKEVGEQTFDYYYEVECE